MDVRMDMDAYIATYLPSNWKRLVEKIENEHLRLPSLRGLNKNQRKRRNEKRMKQSSRYHQKFPEIYGSFPENYEPYYPSATASMPIQVTASDTLYNNPKLYGHHVYDHEVLLNLNGWSSSKWPM